MIKFFNKNGILNLRFKMSRVSGFTLVEMLVAMSIFVIFVGVVMNSYLTVVRAMRDAEEYRVLYSDARHVFDVLTENAREKSIYDPSPSKYVRQVDLQASSSGVKFYSADGEKIEFKFETDLGSSDVSASGRVVMVDDKGVEKKLHSDDVNVKSFMVYVWPLRNPFSGDVVNADGSINYSLLFHPKITFSAVFEKKNSVGEVYSLPLQTSVSLRKYN